MDFGIMFFSSAQGGSSGGAYQLLLDSARFADQHGFNSIWTPERHFHPFGGLYPHPAVVSAALAVITEHLELRAGSLISPLHDVIRIVESWAVVDNLSGGRAGISFGSGWNVDDFVLAPQNYDRRRDVMFEQIAEIRALWDGAKVRREHGRGQEVELELYPKPVRRPLPVWVTSSGNAQTFIDAGACGANVLTHLIGQSYDELAGKIRQYREARGAAGLDPEAGVVTLMLHTFLGDDEAAVEATVRQPFREYLRSAISLEQMSALAGGAISGGHEITAHDIPPRVMEELLDLTFERYYRQAALMGTPASCEKLVFDVAELGVDEIACLIDFLDDPAAILGSLEHVAELIERLRRAEVDGGAEAMVQAFMGDLEG